MNRLLGAFGLADGGLTDVLACLLPRERGCSVDSREFVIGETDRDGFASRVVFAGPAASVGEHEARLAYTPGPESRVGIGIRETLHAEQVLVYAKPMPSTAKDLLMKEMRTNPSLIASVTESLYGATNEYYSIHLTRSAERDQVETLCGRRIRGTGAKASAANQFVTCQACKNAATR